MTRGYVTWPSGEPERAAFSRSWIASQWRMLGPFGMMQSLRGQRMCRVATVHSTVNPVVEARLCERIMVRVR